LLVGGLASARQFTPHVCYCRIEICTRGAQISLGPADLRLNSAVLAHRLEANGFLAAGEIDRRVQRGAGDAE
jgi:ribose 1,5-bisphosphokinase PhnN